MDNLKEARLKIYDKISRYSTIPYYYNETDNKYIYGTTKNLKSSIDYTLYKIEIGDTLDSIALNLYGDALFYWVIADFNKINDPFLLLRPGAFIKIPTLSAIEFEE